MLRALGRRLSGRMAEGIESTDGGFGTADGQAQSTVSFPVPDIAGMGESARANRTVEERANGQPSVKILRAVSGAHIYALFDQAVVSGASFLTMIMIGRWTNPVELGLYAIGVSILLSLLATQQTLISLPYTVQRSCPAATAAEHAGGALVQCGLLALLTIVLLTVAALGLIANGAKPELAALTWTLAGVAPFVLLRDLGRSSLSHACMQAGLCGWILR